MASITSTRIRQSFLTWLKSTSLVSDFKTGQPEEFDPNRDDTQEWVWVGLTRVTRRKAPKPGTERFDVTVTAEVHGRSTDDTLGASTMASKVTDVLGLAKIPIYDYEAVGGPQIGWLMLHEPDEREEPTKTWQTIRIVINGVVQTLV